MKIYIFDKEVRIYGLMIAIGLIASGYYILVKTRYDKKVREDCLYAYALGSVSGMVGAKILYLLVNISELTKDIIHSNINYIIEKYFYGGFVFYGGLIAGYIAAYYLLISYKSNFDKCVPILITACLINCAFGRIGCAIVGCCYGKATIGSIFNVYNNSLYAPNGIKLIPVQIYETIIDFILAMLTNYLSNAEISYRYSINVHLSVYSICRFILEFYRGDEYRGIIFGLSTSQIISVFILMFLYLPKIKNYLKKRRNI